MKYKLVCFDIDGTLVADREGLLYWASLHDVLEGPDGVRVQRGRGDDFRAKRITYKDWVDLDMQGFKDRGFTRADFERVARLHSPTPGALETLEELKRRGYKLAVISGSLSILIDTLFPDHPFDDIFTNLAIFDADGKLAGWKDTVYDHGTKHRALHLICEREGIPLSETVFVGDGENDVDILAEAGLGIAFLPKSEKVSQAADVVVEKDDMREILKYL